MRPVKLFWAGRLQTVQLPKDFRFVGNEVRMCRHGNAIILEHTPRNWGWLDAVAWQVDEDLVRAAQEAPQPQKRLHLTNCFGDSVSIRRQHGNRF
jgi:antitoxin VapB